MYAFKGRPLIDKNSEIKLADEIFSKTEIMVLYFSSSKCSKCRELTPVLMDIYEHSKKRCANLEIINIPVQDSYVNAMKFFATQGDWHSLIPGDHVIFELVFSYSTHTPNITVLTRDGRFISTNGYNEICQYGLNCLVKWL